jgi:hypothetical protein
MDIYPKWFDDLLEAEKDIDCLEPGWFCIDHHITVPYGSLESWHKLRPHHSFCKIIDSNLMQLPTTM